MAQITPADQDVAVAATKLLGELGRGDLDVSPSQVVRWRLAGLFELPEGPRRGRGNLRRYRDDAAQIAAQFRILLETSPKIDEALLLGYASGLDVGIDGVRAGIVRFIRNAAPRLQRAKYPSKRSERFTLPGPRQPYDDLTRQAALDLLMDRDPLVPDWPELVVNRIGSPEATEHFRETGDLERIGEVIRRVSFAGISRMVRDASAADLRWAADTARVLIDYVQEVSRLYEITGTEDPQPVHRVLASLGTRWRTKRPIGEFGLALLAPALLLMTAGPEGRGPLTEAADGCSKEIPKLRALSAAAADLPEKWRRSMGPGGAALLAELPEGEAAELLAQLRQWLADHPDEAQVVSIEVPEGYEAPKT